MFVYIGIVDSLSDISNIYFLYMPCQQGRGSDMKIFSQQNNIGLKLSKNVKSTHVCLSYAIMLSNGIR